MKVPSRSLAWLLICLSHACAGAPVTESTPTVSSTSLRTGEGVVEVAMYSTPHGTNGTTRMFLATRDGERELTSPIYEAWRVEVGDLDGSGEDHIVLGLWSHRASRHEPAPRRTIRVIALERDAWGRLAFVERWRGSALARPLRDFRLADDDGDGRSELVALEALGDRCYRTRYRWNGFGFGGIGRDAIPCDAGL